MNAQCEKLVTICQTTYQNLETIPMSGIPRLKNILAVAPVEALEALIERRVKFCQTFAMRELIRRGLREESDAVALAAEIIERRI